MDVAVHLETAQPWPYFCYQLGKIDKSASRIAGKNGFHQQNFNTRRAKSLHSTTIFIGHIPGISPLPEE
jgi:hypothetical protein